MWFWGRAVYNFWIACLFWRKTVTMFIIFWIIVFVCIHLISLILWTKKNQPKYTNLNLNLFLKILENSELSWQKVLKLYEALLHCWRVLYSCSLFCRYICLIVFFRYIWFPGWPGGPTEGFWFQCDSTQASQDVPTAGVGSHPGRHAYSSYSRRAYLIRIVILSPM